MAMAPLLASLEIFHEAGMDNLVKKNIQLTNYLEKLILSQLSSQIAIITPTNPNDRGCQLSLRFIYSIDNIMDQLNDAGIIADLRRPDVIRIAPVPLYNTFVDCFEFVRRLKSLISEQ